jgi:hypothetical protein
MDLLVEIKYSQLKINHLNDTPSTKADGGGTSVVCLTRTSRYQGHEAELVGTSSSNIYFKLASSKIKDDSS